MFQGLPQRQPASPAAHLICHNRNSTPGSPSREQHWPSASPVATVPPSRAPRWRGQDALSQTTESGQTPLGVTGTKREAVDGEGGKGIAPDRESCLGGNEGTTPTLEGFCLLPGRSDPGGKTTSRECLTSHGHPAQANLANTSLRRASIHTSETAPTPPHPPTHTCTHLHFWLTGLYSPGWLLSLYTWIYKPSDLQIILFLHYSSLDHKVDELSAKQ